MVSTFFYWDWGTVFLFSTRTLGKWSNLTSIFFWWVVQPPTTPLKTNMSPENRWLVQMYSLLKWSLFRGRPFVFRGVVVVINYFLTFSDDPPSTKKHVSHPSGVPRWLCWTSVFSYPPPGVRFLVFPMVKKNLPLQKTKMAIEIKAPFLDRRCIIKWRLFFPLSC